MSELDRVSPHLCFLNRSPWYYIRHGNQTEDGTEDTVVGFYITQERRCLVCGKVQLRKVRT